MSSTRYADLGAPLSQERYMSSPEYVELRGISGNAVTAKAALLGHPAKRSLLFFLQAMSLQPGGLKTFTREFLEMFRERIGTPTMRRLGMKPGQKYDWNTVKEIRDEMPSSAEALAELLDLDWSEQLPALHKESRTAESLYKECLEKLQNLPGFIIELCINPRLRFSVPGESDAAMERERLALVEQFERTSIYNTWDKSHYDSTSLPWFKAASKTCCNGAGCFFSWTKRTSY